MILCKYSRRSCASTQILFGFIFFAFACLVQVDLASRATPTNAHPISRVSVGLLPIMHLLRRGLGPSDAAPLTVRWPSWDNRRREKSRPSSSNGCWQKATVFQLTPPAALAQCHDVWRLATKVLLCHSSLPSPAWPRGLVPPPIASDIFSCEPTAWRWTPRKKVGRRRDSQHPEEGPCW